jgi:hypothetical protein
MRRMPDEHGRTGGRTRVADRGTWRDDSDAHWCGCGLGKRETSGRHGLGIARPREAARGSDAEGWRGVVRGRRRCARAHVPASDDADYPCSTKYI